MVLSPVKNWDLRWDVLKDFLKKENIDLHIDSIGGQEKIALKDQYEKAINEKYDLLILEGGFTEEVINLLKFKTQEVIHLGASNIFVKKNEKLWPTLIFEEALVKAINNSFNELDLNAPALIAGAGPLVRFVVAALSKIGFKELVIVDENIELAKSLKSQLERKFFNIKIKDLEYGEINKLPGEFSLLINTTALSIENKILDELYFFNFLKSQGCVVDLNLIPPITPLLSEAKTWGARLLSGYKIFCLADLLMVENLLGIKLSEDEYCRALFEKVSFIEVDLKQYLKRFMDRI